MTQQLTPAAGHSDSGREDNGFEDGGFPRPRTAGDTARTADTGGDLGVRPGESNPARMLSGVLLLTVAMMLIALTLAWWLV
ncbi:MAG: hypothetical protein M3Y48_25560 [Actinomycetota bacterium]|nr:hypothetical protein [Actinomycetota bacterium]